MELMEWLDRFRQAWTGKFALTCGTDSRHVTQAEC